MFCITCLATAKAVLCSIVMLVSDLKADTLGDDYWNVSLSKVTAASNIVGYSRI